MGQQQFLILILGVLIIGIAIAVGSGVFKANEVDANRSAVINDLQYLSGRARTYYFKPVSMGGGGRDFTNMTISDIAPFTENKNGRYYVETASTSEVSVIGVGKALNGSDTVRVRMRMQERKNIVEVIN